MTHRTMGKTKNCKGCRFWSEMLAYSDGGPVMAMCLSDTGSRANQYTLGFATCESWKSGYFGAVDEPPDYGKETRKLYEKDDVT